MADAEHAWTACRKVPLMYWLEATASNDAEPACSNAAVPLVAVLYTPTGARSAWTALACNALPNVGGKLAPTVGRAGQVGENVQRTAYLARVACRWRSA